MKVNKRSMIAWVPKHVFDLVQNPILVSFGSVIHNTICVMLRVVMCICVPARHNVSRHMIYVAKASCQNQ